jgi:hypothetical protein
MQVWLSLDENAPIDASMIATLLGRNGIVWVSRAIPDVLDGIIETTSWKQTGDEG